MTQFTTHYSKVKDILIALIKYSIHKHCILSQVILIIGSNYHKRNVISVHSGGWNNSNAKDTVFPRRQHVTGLWHWYGITALPIYSHVLESNKYLSHYMHGNRLIMVDIMLLIYPSAHGACLARHHVH